MSYDHPAAVAWKKEYLEGEQSCNNLLQILGRKPFWSDAKRINGNILHTISPDV